MSIAFSQKQVVKLLTLGSLLAVVSGLLVVLAPGSQASGTTAGRVSASESASIAAQAAGAIDIAAGVNHTCAITGDGDVFCWGLNNKGQLGNGDSSGASSNTPVLARLPGQVTAKQVSVGGQHSCAVTTAGDLYCWGGNTDGQLGIGSVGGSKDTPAKVGLGNVKQVSAAGIYTCAVTNSSDAYCWGDNFSGQFGNGSIGGQSSSPQQVNLANVSQISAGGEDGTSSSGSPAHTCAATTSGQGYCWGANAFGQLGTGSSGPDQASPQKIDLAGITALSAGEIHSCAIGIGSRAYCWGNSAEYQLGNGNDSGPSSCSGEPCAPTPILVAGENGDGALPPVSSISAGSFHTCAITTENLTYCWGDNFFGQLGRGTSGSGDPGVFPAPAVSLDRTGPLSQMTVISAGVNYTCGVTSLGVALCWGYNNAGQLGIGDLSPGECQNDLPCVPYPTPVAGQLKVLPDNVNFGTVKVGNTPSQKVEIFSSFLERVTADSKVIGGTSTGFSYRDESDCRISSTQLSIAPLQECKGTVTFAPNRPGTYGGVLRLSPVEYPRSSTEFAASGIAKDDGSVPGKPIVTAKPVAFGEVSIGKWKKSNAKISNTGEGNLKIRKASVKDFKDQFGIAQDNCTGETIKPGQSCKIKVIFQPNSTSQSAATLQLTSNSARGKDAVSLTGTGKVKSNDPFGPNAGPPTVVRDLRSPTKSLKAKSAKISWRKPASDGGSSLTRYQVRIKQVGSKWKKWRSKGTSLNSNGKKIVRYKNLKPREPYKVQARASNAIGNGPAATITFITRAKKVPTRQGNG